MIGLNWMLLVDTGLKGADDWYEFVQSHSQCRHEKRCMEAVIPEPES